MIEITAFNHVNLETAALRWLLLCVC